MMNFEHISEGLAKTVYTKPANNEGRLQLHWSVTLKNSHTKCQAVHVKAHTSEPFVIDILACNFW